MHYNSILSLRLFHFSKCFDGLRRLRLLATSGEKSALREFAIVFPVMRVNFHLTQVQKIYALCSRRILAILGFRKRVDKANGV